MSQINRKKNIILWLPSWYPSKVDRFTGDFIQRHAQAVAQYQPLAVIYVVKDEGGQYAKNMLEETVVKDNLQETIVYYKPVKTRIKVIDQLISSATYLSICKKLIKRFIAREGKPAFIHVHVPVRAGILAQWIRKVYGIPFIVTEHWCAYNKLNPNNFFKRGPVFRRLTKNVFESAAIVTTVCEANRKELLQLFSIQKSIVVNNVADTRLFYFQKTDFSLPFIFLHVSSLTSQKNVEGILDAFAVVKKDFQNWRCIVVGPQNDTLIAHSKRLGLESFIEWTGEQSYESVATYTREAHCMIMFSRFENSPCTIVEALSAGVPVIGTHVGGIPEIVDATNGLLVASEDIVGLARTIKQMIANYHLYNRYEIAEKAAADFSYETIGTKIASLYKI